MMFGRFTERAQKVLALAQEEALRLGHNNIGTEHILLGIVRGLRPRHYWLLV
jgi:ATP-dependent Clp protease ATP-binding subunit ClpC